MTNYLEVKNLSKSFDSFQLHNIRLRYTPTKLNSAH